MLGPDAMILVVWMLSLKPTFLLSSFTFIKRLFSSSLSAILVVLSAYLRLLTFLLAILISAFASSSPVFLMMYSAITVIAVIYIIYIYIYILYNSHDITAVDHNKLWKILQEIGLPDHLTCLVRNLYAGQEATVRTEHGTTDWFQIGKGLCQGCCILSPCLFNLYAEYIMWNAGLDEAEAGIKIAGRNINNLRYADDTTLMAENEKELKSLLMKEESEKVCLRLNIQKTNIMASGPITSWQIDRETVADFIFRGSKIAADGDCSHEIKRHLLLGRKVMTNLDTILKSRDITLPTKVRLVKALVFLVVMYGCESWI